MAHSVQPLDNLGNPAGGVIVAGTGATPAAAGVVGRLPAVRNLTYSPQGSTIDAIPPFSFQVPLAEWQSLAADIGAQIGVTDDETALQVAQGPVTAIERTVDSKGALWATVTCDDLLGELARESATSGFVTATNEPFATTLLRIAALSLGPGWTPVNIDITGYDGVPFACYNRSVLQAFLDLAQARFAHIRRAAGRVLFLGHFGGASGLRMEQPGANATAQAAEGQALVILPGVSFKRDGRVANSLTPTGAGDGGSALTLRPLYNAAGETVVPMPDGTDKGMRQSGPASFTGYDPLHPIRRRPNGGNNASFDGFDYLIEDDDSISHWARCSAAPTHGDIGPVVNSAGAVSTVDEVAAAVALYAVTLSELKWSAQPKMEIAVATSALGRDLTNLGGQTIHVRYTGAADDVTDPTQPINVALNVEGDYTVMNVVVTEGTKGEMAAQWTLTSGGQYIRSTTELVLNAIDQSQAQGTAVQTYPMAKPRPKSQNIGPGADMNIEIFADNSIVRRHWAILYLTLEGMVHTRSDTGHTQDVVTDAMNHDVNAVPHDVNALTSVQYRIGGNPLANGAVDYDPSTKLHIVPNPPGGAVAVMYDPVGQTFYYSGATHGTQDVPLASSHLGIVQVNPTANGTGGKVKATTGASTGAGQVGGVVPTATHLKSSGLGALSAVATQESVYRGPSPTGVTVWVDGAQRFGPFNSSPPPLDITPYVNNQALHTVTIKSPTNGACDVFIDVRDDVTTLATRPTG